MLDERHAGSPGCGNSPLRLLEINGRLVEIKRGIARWIYLEFEPRTSELSTVFTIGGGGGGERTRLIIASVLRHLASEFKG